MRTSSVRKNIVPFFRPFKSLLTVLGLQSKLVLFLIVLIFKGMRFEIMWCPWIAKKTSHNFR